MKEISTRKLKCDIFQDLRKVGESDNNSEDKSIFEPGARSSNASRFAYLSNSSYESMFWNHAR
ncbi:hypothetical protein DASC09_044580 [Saccharomycopsis crataegensis]|uniref:Uncharacterized protein n=1 Tax=Saccharomycopsis crataegensis TaxID=43959 RepID=A0AAV5QQQ8_9ASCO|nr:hypothetical protein DASC09_044580 [Saccharomycopsis crataegensis]